MGGCRERLAINSVAIAQQVAWCTIPGEGLDQLPGRPILRGGERLRQSEGVGGDHETEPEKRKGRRNVAVGTTKKSVETSSLA